MDNNNENNKELENISLNDLIDKVLNYQNNLIEHMRGSVDKLNDATTKGLRAFSNHPLPYTEKRTIIDSVSIKKDGTVQINGIKTWELGVN